MPLVPDEVNYFEAPPGARLEPDTDYTLVLGTATDQSFLGGHEFDRANAGVARLENSVFPRAAGGFS